MKKEVVVLAFVVAAVVMINFSLILIIESSKPDPVSQKIIRAVTGYNQLEVFNVQNFPEQAYKKTTSHRKTSEKEVSTKSTETQATPARDIPLIEEIQPIVDPVIMPVPYIYYDYDGDGNFDLVRKERDGNNYVYFNKGTNENKFFKEGTKIKEEDLVSRQVQYIMPSESYERNTKDTQAWHYISYPRFDLYIEDGYYNNNSANLNAFFDNFAERYDLLENTTGWSVEEYYPGYKLRLNVFGNPGICGSGVAVPGISNMTLGNPFPNPGCQWPYYINGTPYLGNPGELGDYWLHMTTPIHESLHSINPLPIYLRLWLTEGFSQYNHYNVLVKAGDINQETADYYINRGTINWNWTGYTNNDYRDRLNNPIQQSSAYDISAWMFSMMRNDHNLDWSKFYYLIDKNNETLYKTYNLRSQSIYYTDMYIIDVFGRASNKNFNQTKDIWKYNGSTGCNNGTTCWGVRNWTDLNWYADLNPDLIAPAGAGLNQNFTLTAKVYNNGNVSLINVPVKIYMAGCVLLKEAVVNISSYNYTNVSVNYSGPYSSVVNFVVKVDEDNIKIEKDDTNNQDSASVSIGCYTYFDKKLWKWVNTCPPGMQSTYYACARRYVS